MKKLLCLLLALVMLFTLAACGGDDTATGDTGADAGTSDTGDTGSSGDSAVFP